MRTGAAERFSDVNIMQQRNLIFFLLCAFLVVIIGDQVKQRLWPTKSHPQTSAAESAEALWPWRTRKSETQAQALVGLLATAPAAIPSLSEVSRLGTSLMLASPDELRFLVALSQPKPPRPSVPAAPHEKPVQIVLGNDESALKVVLTSAGASVQRVTLNKFQKADASGLPVVNPEGKPLPLDLIPDDPDQQRPPSFRLYHYADADKDEHPVNELGERVWKLTGQSAPETQPQWAAFTTELPDNGVRLVKTYSLMPGDYHIGLEVKVQPTRANIPPFRYQLEGPHGLPIEGIWYTGTFRNAILGWESGGSNWRQFEDSARISTQLGGDVVSKAPGKIIRYAAVAVQYFASVIAVDNQQKSVDFIQHARATVEDTGPPLGKKPRPSLDDITVRMISDPLTVPANGEVVHKYLLYNGPVKVRLLNQISDVDPALVDRYETILGLRTLTDYHSQSASIFRFLSEGASWLGWTALLIWCTNLMHKLLWVLHAILPSYGLCIIVLTLAVRAIMYPVSRKQAIMSQRMQELAPEMKQIQEKYADDPQQKTRAVWELYGKHGVNPAMGCLPLLLQMPIFLGLYYALMESMHFRLAPFLWIRNLAAPDMMFDWSNLGQVGNQMLHGVFGEGGFLGPFFNLLPFFTVALMIVQQRMMTPPAMDEQQAMQQTMMKWMTLFLGFVFYKMAAGLCLYIITSSLWGLAERKLLPKRPIGGSGATAATQPKPAPRGKPRSPQPKEPTEPSLRGKMKEMWEDILREARKK